MLRCKISPQIDNLNQLHEKYPWIPNSEQIRPISNLINDKNKLLSLISLMYHNYDDYINEYIFGFNTLLLNQKYFVPKINIIKKNVFRENNFPYQISNNCHHYILWFSYKPFSETEINSIILNKLFNLLNHSNFDFVWYENPKKSIVNSYHYQVFWIEN